MQLKSWLFHDCASIICTKTKSAGMVVVVVVVVSQLCETIISLVSVNFEVL